MTEHRVILIIGNGKRRRLQASSRGGARKNAEQEESAVRVIAGSARHLPLKTVSGLSTRPTTDRIKETLFNMLRDEVPGAAFLDLFAGSGGIGIEALSRGASRAVFVEKDRRCARCIQENLAFTKLADRADVVVMDVFRALLSLPAAGEKKAFDVIFMDPPYDRLLERQVLEALKTLPVADENTLIIAEASLQTDFSYLPELGYEVVKRKEYKTNVHMFLKKRDLTETHPLSE